VPKLPHVPLVMDPQPRITLLSETETMRLESQRLKTAEARNMFLQLENRFHIEKQILQRGRGWYRVGPEIGFSLYHKENSYSTEVSKQRFSCYSDDLCEC